MQKSSVSALFGSALMFALLAAACIKSTEAPGLDAGTIETDAASGPDTESPRDSGPLDSASDAKLPDADADEPKCASFGQEGQPVTVTTGSLPAPEAVGGGIASGTYVRTSVKQYGDAPASLSAKAQTIWVTTTSISAVTGGLPGGGDERAVIGYRTREQYMFLKVSCDTVLANVGQEYSATYTATSTTLTLYTEPTDGTAGIVETVFTLKP